MAICRDGEAYWPIETHGKDRAARPRLHRSDLDCVFCYRGIVRHAEESVFTIVDEFTNSARLGLPSQCGRRTQQDNRNCARESDHHLDSDASAYQDRCLMEMEQSEGPSIGQWRPRQSKLLVARFRARAAVGGQSPLYPQSCHQRQCSEGPAKVRKQTIDAGQEPLSQQSDWRVNCPHVSGSCLLSKSANYRQSRTASDLSVNTNSGGPLMVSRPSSMIQISSIWAARSRLCVIIRVVAGVLETSCSTSRIPS